MGTAAITSTLRTVTPLMFIPRMAAALSAASSGVAASLTPPALPRPPTSTCALTATLPADARGDLAGLLRCGGDLARRDGDAELPHDVFGLILVDLHCPSPSR